MNSSALSWYVETNKGFLPKSEHFAGSYRQGETIYLNLYLWNNRWGTEDCESIAGVTLKLHFAKLENSVMLPEFKYSVDGSSKQSLSIDNNIGYAEISKALSGKRNDGSLDGNPDNYVKVAFEIKITEGMTENLKQLFITPLLSGGV